MSFPYDRVPYDRLPVEPLEEALCARLARRGVRPAGPGVGDPNLASAGELADLCGTTARTWHRWRTGGVPAPTADRVACDLGYHPLDIWPDWLEVSG